MVLELATKAVANYNAAVDSLVASEHELQFLEANPNLSDDYIYGAAEVKRSEAIVVVREALAMVQFARFALLTEQQNSNTQEPPC